MTSPSSSDYDGAVSRLINCLEQVSVLRDSSSRRLALDLLAGQGIQLTVDEFPSTRMHLISIVQACRRHDPRALGEFINVVEMLEPGSLPVQRARAAFEELAALERDSREPLERPGAGPIAAGGFRSEKSSLLAELAATPPRLQGIPFGSPLNSYTGPVVWGAWGQVDGQPVLATGGMDGPVRLWDPRIGSVLGEPLAGHVGATLWGVWGQVDGRPVLATGGYDKSVRLWDPRSGGVLGEPLMGHTDRIFWGAWGQVDGRPVLATGGMDGPVRLWDPRTGGALGEPLTGHTRPIWWGAWGQVDGQPVLATGSGDGTVRLWDPRTGSVLGPPLTGHTGRVGWGVWDQDFGLPVFATGGEDGTVRLWDPRTGSVLGPPLTGHTGPVFWGVCGPVDDRPVLATGGDETVRLWDLSAGSVLGEPLTGHTGPVVWGVWGQVDDRPVLATGGYDKSVRLWDLRTGSALGEPLTGRAGQVFWGVWGEVDDRPVLAAGGDDGAVRLWEVIEDRPVPRLPSYRSDVTGPVDELGRVGDAVALAELLTARSARPPLAVGLFGDWGEGKSHFLGLLREQVRLAARPDNTLAHTAVRQVWFNAWHYAETDLWASLVAELFAQLSRPESGGDPSSEQRSQSRLTAELVAERGLRERLAVARDRHKELTAALRRVDPDRSWKGLTSEQKQQLALLGADDPEALYRKVVRTGAALRETGQGWWRLLRDLRTRTLIALAVLIAATVAIAWGVPVVARWVAALPGAATILALAALATRLVGEAKTRASHAWQAAVQLARKHTERLRTATDVAAAEVAELEREMRDLTAAGQLAGLVAERASATGYRGRLGLMTQIRDDFQRMAQLLARVDRDKDAAGDLLPRIDRIVLYIDDLDRCPPHRVIEMLEAIHLLLAVDLFVVVVAVDPRWLLRAITAHYRDLLDTPGTSTMDSVAVDPDDEELWRSTPAQYLEKIFQVVFTLPPLDSNGYQRLLRTLVGTRVDQPTPEAEVTPAREAKRKVNVETLRVATEHASETQDSMFGVQLPAARVVERVDPLTLEPDELTLLDLLGPPLLVSTPRGVKRLANSYGLLTATRRNQRADDLAEHQTTLLDSNGEEHDVTYHPYRAGLVLLGALVAYPAFGPAILLHLHHTNIHGTWQRYLADLTPTQRGGGWASTADPAMTPVQAQQWLALVNALHRITSAAADHNLPLPELIGAWAEWIVPVGRLSFPAGRIVNALGRQPPLTTMPDS